jgi:hypothetical protein
LSAKLVPTFADRRVLHGQCGGSPTAVISVLDLNRNVRVFKKNAPTFWLLGKKHFQKKHTRLPEDNFYS